MKDGKSSDAMTSLVFVESVLRGDFKTIIGLQYIGAMNHPGGGRNDIPNRLKSKFFSLNMILPSLTSVDNIYGAMIRSRVTLKNGAIPLVRASHFVVVPLHSVRMSWSP